MKAIVLMLIACFFGILNLGAQDFVQPVNRSPVRIKNTKREHKDNKRSRVEIKDFEYQHFKFSVNAGYSHQTSLVKDKIPTPLTDYVKDLKSGSDFGLDFRYYPVEPVGFGIKYSGYTGRSSKAILTSPSKYSTMDKDLTVQFIGPCLSTRYLHADMKNAVYCNLAYGYVSYRLNYLANVEFSARGKTMATVYDLGYDLGLTQNVGVGFQVSYFKGILKEYNGIYNGEKQNVTLEPGKYERLHRLDFSIGIKLNL